MRHGFNDWLRVGRRATRGPSRLAPAMIASPGRRQAPGGRILFVGCDTHVAGSMLLADDGMFVICRTDAMGLRLQTAASHRQGAGASSVRLFPHQASPPCSPRRSADPRSRSSRHPKLVCWTIQPPRFVGNGSRGFSTWPEDRPGVAARGVPGQTGGRRSGRSAGGVAAGGTTLVAEPVYGSLDRSRKNTRHPLRRMCPFAIVALGESSAERYRSDEEHHRSTRMRFSLGARCRLPSAAVSEVRETGPWEPRFGAAPPG